MKKHSNEVITPFHRWVANTVQNLGGNSTTYLCGIGRKLVPTFDETRIAPCQWGFDIYFVDNSQALACDFAVVDTNKRWLH